MQAGFAFLETGWCKNNNQSSVMMKNLADACLGLVGWYILGFGIAMGEVQDSDGSSSWAGKNRFALSNKKMREGASGLLAHTFFFQWTFCAAAATIVSGALAERVALRGFFVLSFLLSSVIYPFVVHWQWAGGWLYQRGFQDFAGSGVVHMFGGTAGLVAAAILGPRTGRFSDEESDEYEGVSKRDIVSAPKNLHYITLGTFILWFGWYGFNCGSELGVAGGSATNIGIIACNTTISAAFGGVTSFFIGSFFAKSWSVADFCNGVLGGLVGITAGCNGMETGLAALTGAISGVVVYFAAKMLDVVKIDDPVGAWAVHGACGAWGVIAVGLFTLKDSGVSGRATGCKLASDDCYGLFYGGSFTWLLEQVLGIGVIAVWAIVCTAVVCIVLKTIGQFRVSEEVERTGVDMELAGIANLTRGKTAKTKDSAFFQPE